MLHGAGSQQQCVLGGKANIAIACVHLRSTYRAAHGRDYDGVEAADFKYAEMARHSPLGSSKTP